MRADIIHVEGAPGPTLVLDRARLPPGALAARAELGSLLDWLERTGRGGIRKIALYGESRAPGFDLDYRFVQRLPGGFDFRVGCGHSLLACVVAARRRGAVRVRALTTGDTVVCEPDGGEPGAGAGVGEPGAGAAHTVRFAGPGPGHRLLPTRRPVERVGGLDASLVCFGNPYLLVDAAALGVCGAEQLFAGGEELLRPLLRARAHAARLLGVAPGAALPKVAAVGADPSGLLYARGVTVGGWHPGLALTGAACLAAATALPGTLAHRLTGGGPATSASASLTDLRIRTPGGVVHASVTATGTGTGTDTDTDTDTGPRIGGVAVHGKRARVAERAVRLPWRIRVTA